VGDGLIAQVSERLRVRIRKSDTLARLGGDEFTIVLSRLNSKEEAGLVAKNLLEITHVTCQRLWKMARCNAHENCHDASSAVLWRLVCC